MKHQWTECDDIVALYLYKYGTSIIGLSVGEVAQKLNSDKGSMKMRIQNFQNINGAGGLSNVASQSRKIFKQFSVLLETDLRAKALECLKGNHPK